MRAKVKIAGNGCDWAKLEDDAEADVSTCVYLLRVARRHAEHAHLPPEKANWSQVRNTIQLV